MSMSLSFCVKLISSEEFNEMEMPTPSFCQMNMSKDYG